jgi:hypothetical protein
MAENKDVKQGGLKFFSAPGCGQPSIFLPRIHIAIETRSASLFADSIAFLEGASVAF